MIQTILLENDDWHHRGTDEWIAQFGEYKEFNPNIREMFWEEKKSRDFCMLLSQPWLKHVCAVSTFEMPVSVKLDNDRTELIKQIEHYSSFIRDVDHFRQSMGYDPIEYHLVYLSESDFLEALHDGDLGQDTLANLYLIARQEPERFKVSIYDKDFKFQYDLCEEFLEPQE